jgi:murein DD-endopeptidase MepM/ murein hydrolase activator NlpD
MLPISQMVRLSLIIALLIPCVVLVCDVLAASPEEERLIGSECDLKQLRDCLPFTHAVGVSGFVKDGLAQSIAVAGVPQGAMVEVLKAFATTIDINADVHDGDGFYVRYERSFTSVDTALETDRILWIELRTAAKGSLALHRFRPASNDMETFWLSSGRGAAKPVLKMPLATITVTSGFGLRGDPVDQPLARGVFTGPADIPWQSQNRRQPVKALMRDPQRNCLTSVNLPTARGLSLGLSPAGGRRCSNLPSAFTMHEGVDLMAALGTPVFAAGDGVVRGAEPKGRYGNWIEIEHTGALATVYGHLSGFAPDVVAGHHVNQGDLIGFTGNTGRTTGPHLHFEILFSGRPVNPIDNPATKYVQLRGTDLDDFRKIVARDIAERDGEANAPIGSAASVAK